MVKEFAVVGGDLRTIKLAKILAKEGNMVYTYGLEKAEELKEIKNIIFTLLLHLPWYHPWSVSQKQLQR